MSFIVEKKNTQRVIRLSVFLVSAVFLIKLITLFFSSSMVFFAEFVDSLADFFVVIITFFALKQSSKPADLDHMYGHEKINSFASILQSMITIFVYTIIIYLSLELLISYPSIEILNPGLGGSVLIIIIIMNFFVSRIITGIGNKTNNATIKAQGVNFRGDLFRNIGIVFSLFFTFFFPEFSIIDPIIAIIFSIKAIIESFLVFKQGYDELMDYNAIDPEKTRQLKDKILKISGVEYIDSLAIRTVANEMNINIILSFDRNKETLYSINETNILINDIINVLFPDFNCNLYIQTNISTPEDLYKKFIEIIRYKSLKFEKIEGIHNIFLNILNEKMIIQFHLLIKPNTYLKDAHDIVSSFEHFIKMELSRYLKNKDIQIISHIEPSEEEKDDMSIQSYDSVDIENLSIFYKEIIKDLIEKTPAIINYNDLNLINGFNGIYLSFRISLKDNLTVQEFHLITERLEFYIREKIPNLKKCIIHAEPINPK